MHWQTTRFQVDLLHPKIMGIVNVTPDSFSDGGQQASTRAALAHCENLLKDGAHLLDIGGESTRPGATPLPLAEELARVLPVVRGAVKLGIPISVDTYKPQVMQAVLDAGADIINGIWALRQAGAREVIAAHPSCGVCLMHMHGNPQTMQLAPMQGDAAQGVISQVQSFLLSCAQQLESEGVASDRIVLDPGIGFGKTVVQNFNLLAQQEKLSTMGYPLLLGWSRKSALGAVTGLEVNQRQLASVVAAMLAIERGANIVRVHDVAQTAVALKVMAAMKESL